MVFLLTVHTVLLFITLVMCWPWIWLLTRSNVVYVKILGQHWANQDMTLPYFTILYVSLLCSTVGPHIWLSCQVIKDHIHQQGWLTCSYHCKTSFPFEFSSCLYICWDCLRHWCWAGVARLSNLDVWPLSTSEYQCTVDVKCVILNASICFWHSHITTHAFSIPERWGEHSDVANQASDRYLVQRQECTCWEAFPKFITNVFTYNSGVKIATGALCYLWLTEWSGLLSDVLLYRKWMVLGQNCDSYPM